MHARLLGTILLFAGVVASQAAAQDRAVRILALVGGEHHAYEANIKSVLDSLREGGMKCDANIIRIDAPPPGKPNAEKATIASKPDILKDPDLINKYDLILQYTQDSYIEALGSDHVDGILHFVRNGGGWVGWHCAADTFKSYPEYVKMVGGKFETHPAYGALRIQRITTHSPVGSGIEDFDSPDELYHLADATAADKDLILVTRSPGDSKTRPVAWTRRYGAGKVFYTVLGHGPDIYKHASFKKLMQNAAGWCAERDGNGIAQGGWISLFNGKDLAGWTMSGPGRFIVENGEMVATGGMGLLWYDRRSFKDFVLELEWKVVRKEDNSGVFVRFPMPFNPWTPVNSGYEIQIGDTYGAKQNTGSIYSFQAATKIPTKAAGEWNQYRIEVIGQKYTITINGEKVNEFTGDRSVEGFVGLQNHDDESRVRFRNLKISPR
ncbi:MAG: family 16 glycoside hydrolase [Planctomycetota bacterium]